MKSDKRILGGKISECILCLENKQLLLSHIIPKWAYRWSKAEDRGRIVGNYPSINKRVIHQDGCKHYLLCGECEQLLSVGEKYIKSLMHGSPSEQAKLGVTVNDDQYVNVNFRLVQQFVFGLALKAHYATAPPFHNFSLNKRYLETLGKRVLCPQDEDEMFPIVAMQFHSKVIPEINSKCITISHHYIAGDGTEVSSFLFAGWEWCLFFNEDRKIDPVIASVVERLRLKKEGVFRVPHEDIVNQRHIKYQLTKNKVRV